MSIRSNWLPALSLPLLCVQFAAAAAGPPAAAADPAGTRREFAAAMQRVRLNLPETPDSPALEARSEEHTSELQSLAYLVCRLLLEKKKKKLFLLLSSTKKKR